ncbi:MAG: hypothetical protein QOG25_2594 [Acetobacteraceae bacterium]|jgi:hypothetical protein|nr:hypothetical protein [Acetobacteraceae bacterium]
MIDQPGSPPMQQQEPPGYAAKMMPNPDHGELCLDAREGHGEQDVQLRCIRLDSSGHGGVDDLIRHAPSVFLKQEGSTLVSIVHRGVSARIAD